MKALLRKLLRSDPLPTLKRRGLVVGENFYMQDGCVIDAWHCGHIRIGNDVTLGPNVTVLAHDASTRRALGLVRIAKVSIGDRVFIGAGSIVLPGVSIGSDVIIGAGSVVTRDVPDGSVAAGNPAAVTGSLADYLARKREEMAAVPNFGEEYTLRAGADAARIAEMNARMTDGIGYIA
ncbi:DapH/DapD/GlmU-related protein [Uliginosibacterium sp. H3]|uniref:DapH/DapD/GlmU-related protein n=1 Tax=Uliginosibacterium silvisoli TaxID=3114758 RepID=A0ABU6K9G3_9RHOO|nr:DapH/DapD/GlmU-related protein [Uliginosibacterium sp. H3]